MSVSGCLCPASSLFVARIGSGPVRRQAWSCAVAQKASESQGPCAPPFRPLFVAEKKPPPPAAAAAEPEPAPAPAAPKQPPPAAAAAGGGAAPAGKKAAPAGKAGGKKAAGKPIGAAMDEDVIPALKEILGKEKDIENLALIFDDNEVSGGTAALHITSETWC